MDLTETGLLVLMFSLRVWWTVFTGLLYLLRKCMFVVSAWHLYVHCTQLFVFLSCSTQPTLGPAHSHKFRFKHKSSGATRDVKNSHKKDAIPSHPERSRGEDDLLLNPRQAKRLALEAKFERRISRTLQDIGHRNNFASAKDYWTRTAISSSVQPERRSLIVVESDSSSLLSPGHASTVQYTSEQQIYVDANSSRSSESFLLIKESENSSDSLDEEFIRAFKDSDNSSGNEDEIIQVSINSLDKNDNYSISEEFGRFVEGSDFLQLLEDFSSLLEKIGIFPGNINDFFPPFREFVTRELPHKFDELLDKLEIRRNQPEYKRGLIGRGKKVLIIGAGPCGLRLAMETQLLGAETTIMESRSSIDRNNILKLWTFVLEDLKNLGAKKLCPTLGIGCVNHISIKTLQFTLLKICLMLGVRVKPNESFRAILEPSLSSSWPVISEVVAAAGETVEVEEEFDVVIGATGRRVTLDGFDRQSLDAKLAIAITANFRNFHSVEEKYVKEIPGLSKQYDLDFFTQLEERTRIKLENIVYYQGSTHYFVMTAKKQSLLEKGVIIKDLGERSDLLRPENIDRRRLEAYAREAAEFSTAHFSHQLPSNPFSTWKGVNDVSIFDFTNLYRSQNACRVVQRNSCTLLTGLVGDSLLEPFWPEGTGIGQGFLGVLDTAWMIKKYFENTKLFELIREREKLYCLLRQTTQTTLKKNYEKWSIDPTTRYNTTTFHFNQAKIYHLLDTDQPSSGDDIIDSSQEMTKDWVEEVRRRKKSKKDVLNHTRETMFFAD